MTDIICGLIQINRPCVLCPPPPPHSPTCDSQDVTTPRIMSPWFVRSFILSTSTKYYIIYSRYGGDWWEHKLVSINSISLPRPHALVSLTVTPPPPGIPIGKSILPMGIPCRGGGGSARRNFRKSSVPIGKKRSHLRKGKATEYLASGQLPINYFLK